VESSDPLVDNFPHRLSPVNRNWKDGVPVYQEFMNSKQSFDNFMNSKNIAKFWPASMKESTRNFFSSRWVVNDLLMSQKTAKYSQIYTLHQCIHNPYLTDYIPWALESDYDAIEIVKSTLNTTPKKDWNMVEMKNHLVAMAVISGDYALAEKILSENVELVNNEKKWRELMLRIYLLLMTKNEEKVHQISNHYLKTCENPDIIEKKIAKIINWSRKAIHSGQVSLWNEG